MNRRTKIIVSVAGIFIVLLALLGLTYGYFLTRVNGNSNEKSIDVSLARLEITYDNDDASILGEGKKINPGESPIGTKTFSVTNNGNASADYMVVFENITVKDYLGNDTTFNTNDFRYTLSCTNCKNSVNTKSIFPIKGGVAVINSIEKDATQKYTLTMYYLDIGNQSDDMGKSLNAKVNIKSVGEYFSKYSNPNTNLAYHIISNALNAQTSNRTKYKTTSDTTLGTAANESERIMLSTPDDYGTSFYYRGNVEDNYLSVFGRCWRIVRIEGDKSIKLVLEGTTCETGNWHMDASSNSGLVEKGIYATSIEKFSDVKVPGMSKAFYEFQNYLSSAYYAGNSFSSYLKDEAWCVDTSYKTYSRLIYDSVYGWIGTGPSLVCYGTKYNNYIGSLTADEVVLAGGLFTGTVDIYEARNNYLINDYTYNGANNFWTLSPESSDSAIYVHRKGYLNIHENNSEFYYRPSIVLRSGISWVSGDGTKTNPFRIN